MGHARFVNWKIYWESKNISYIISNFVRVILLHIVQPPVNLSRSCSASFASADFFEPRCCQQAMHGQKGTPRFRVPWKEKFILFYDFFFWNPAGIMNFSTKNCPCNLAKIDQLRASVIMPMALCVVVDPQQVIQYLGEIHPIYTWAHFYIPIWAQEWFLKTCVFLTLDSTPSSEISTLAKVTVQVSGSHHPYVHGGNGGEGSSSAFAYFYHFCRLKTDFVLKKMMTISRYKKYAFKL